ncbi:hypothetical protein M5F00_11260 [Acinetobacter sp. ANC 4945]|uniref:Uncharacterized protein n=1 Tax=Acinetobacter amyesii TaxID=2942470 RepID=A0A1T1GQ20_9GAMM|nr:hypothetical protein [Acinetobacter amyesii]MCL6248435.1 hypothetical protein [Acinetobacter amyesii]OOV79678.1 hypothetical protein B1202_16130 [Acinetobacter amyesii]
MPNNEHEHVHSKLIQIMEDTIDIADIFTREDANNEMLSEQLHNQMFELRKVIRDLKKLSQN